jgi:hypothetical protein
MDWPSRLTPLLYLSHDFDEFTCDAYAKDNLNCTAIQVFSIHPVGWSNVLDIPFVSGLSGESEQMLTFNRITELKSRGLISPRIKTGLHGFKYAYAFLKKISIWVIFNAPIAN